MRPYVFRTPCEIELLVAIGAVMRPYVFRTPCEIELLVPFGAVISMEGFGELSSHMESDGQIDMSMGIVVDMFVCTSMATDIDFLMVQHA